MHMSVAILRTEKGLDYTDVLATGTDSSDATKDAQDHQLNGSVGDPLALVLGSNESLNRTGSQGRCLQPFRIQKPCW